MKKVTRPTSPVSREKTILFGFAVQKRCSDGRVEVDIRWGRLMGTVFVLAVAGWLLTATLLFFFFKHRRDFDEVTFSGMLTLPFRLDAHRTEMGDYHVEKGLKELKEGNYRDAHRLLALGVTRSPGNLEGRTVLAEFYEIAYKRADIAADLLKKGLEYGGIEDPEYIKRVLGTLLRNQMDEAVQEICDKYLPEEAELTDINKILAFGAANANYLRGNYDQADDYLISYRLIDSEEGLLLSSKISWDRGNKRSAISLLEDSLKRLPDSEALLIQLSKYHREMGDIDSARRYAILRNVKSPLSARPKIELLYIYDLSGDTERKERETQSMLKQFHDDESALLSLANFAADTGDTSLARRTYEVALENEFGIDSFALLLIESHLVKKDFEGALNFTEELLKERPDWLTVRWGIYNSLRAVASYGLDRPDLGEIYLQDFIEEDRNRPQTFIAVANRFIEINRPQQARKVLLAGYEQAPMNQKILSELIRVELDLGNTENLNRFIPKLLQMRRPQIDLLADAYRKLGSDRFIFTPDRENLLLQLSAILRENSRSITNLDS